jgi:uncharacterized protein with von Willebrand factor type A (vWA) domain
VTQLKFKYAALDALPKKLFVPVVQHVHGHVEERAASVVLLRAALLDGRTPDPAQLPWPGPELRATLFESLERSGVLAVCRGEPDVVDELLASVLDAVIGAETLCASATAHFAGLALAEHQRRMLFDCPPCNGSSQSKGDDVCVPRGGSAQNGVADGLLADARSDARRLAIEVATAKIRADVAEVGERAVAIKHLRELLILIDPRRGWTLGRAALKAVAARSIAEMHRLVAHIEQLRELITLLGRLKSPDETSETIFEQISGPMRRSLPRPQPQRKPEAGVELRDIDRSADFTRMLPSEALWLTHPTLVRAWHAKRAESALLVYRAENDARVIRMEEQAVSDGADLEAQRQVAGPVIVCLDTSGSMKGTPGLAAKAVVLHLTMLAADERRPVHVFSFSGPGDVVEHTLGFEEDASAELLAFLTLDFSGGTDVAEPLRLALERHDQAEWSNADILLVSDGQFWAPDDIVEAIEARRASSALRVHGLLLGPDSEWMEKVCSPVHRMADWVEDGDASS